VVLEKVSWTDRVRNEEILQRFKEERNILHTMKRRKANWIGHILRRNVLLKHVVEEEINVTGRRGRRRKQLVIDLKVPRRCWKFQDEALDRNL
jgi:replicative superfamily II helicase